MDKKIENRAYEIMDILVPLLENNEETYYQKGVLDTLMWIYNMADEPDISQSFETKAPTKLETPHE